MTREEAIKVLKDLWRYEHSEFSEKDIRKALGMAIKALEQEPILDKIRDFEEAMAEFADGKIYIQVSDVLNLLHKYIKEV